MPESLKPAAAIYLLFLCCRPLFFFPPENILRVVYEPSLFLLQIPNALVCVCPVCSAFSSLRFSLLPPRRSSLSHIHRHTNPVPWYGAEVTEKEPKGKKKRGFKVPIKSRLVGAWEGRGQKGLLCRGFPTCLCLKTGHWASSNPADCLASSPVMDLTVISLPPVREEAS